MGTRENKFQGKLTERFCTKTGKISSSVSFHHNFQVFHTKFNIHFRRLVLLEFFFFLRRYLKQSYRSLQYNVNNLGTRFLSTCYSNFWWIPSWYYLKQIKDEDEDLIVRHIGFGTKKLIHLLLAFMQSTIKP